MKLSTFLTINAIMFLPFGLIMLIVPEQIFTLIGLNLDSDGLLVASMVGSMLLSFGILCLVARKEAQNTLGMKAIIIANMTFHFIDSFLTGKGALLDVLNSMAYVFSVMHLLFALGFLYFLYVNHFSTIKKLKS